ncbi:MAG: hypothetical protein SGPRY_012006, partial [Prymnesium sp.]
RCDAKKSDLLACKCRTLMLKIARTTDQEADHKQSTGELVHDILGQVMEQVYEIVIVFHTTETDVYHQLVNIDGIDLTKKKIRVATINRGLIHVPITCVLDAGELKAFIADKLDKVGLRLNGFRNMIDKTTQARTLKWRFEFDFFLPGYSLDLLKGLAPLSSR